MSEWLTTGQMIDRLKKGETAEGNTHWEVKKTADGGGFDAIVELNSGDQVFLSESFMKEKWRIIPNYVSFEEAMKAHKEKKTVVYYHDEELQYRFEHSLEPNQFQAVYHDSICLHEMINGKWIVEE